MVPEPPPAGGEGQKGGAKIAKIAWSVITWIEFALSWVWKWIGKVVLITWQRLNFAMQQQQQTNWCWAAVATSTALFYDPSSSWTQCTLVNAELGQTTCCTNGGSAACNKTHYLDKALTRVGHFGAFSSGAMSFADLRNQIDAGRPLGVRIDWGPPDHAGHFMVIDGYLNDATRHVAIDDPFFGASDMSYTAFSGSYQSSGTWSHSYTTQP